MRNLPLDHIYMQEEISAIDNAIEHQQSTVGLGFWQPFKTVANDKKVMWRFFLGGALFFWQNGSGINAINYYSPTVFRSIGVTGTNTGLLTTGIFGVIKTVLTFVWLLYLIDHLGRRNLLMIGALGGSLCLWYVGGYIAVAKPEQNPRVGGGLSSGGISAMFFFYLWTAFYTPSWNGTPWVLNSEMFDQNVRILAQAFAAGNNWFWNFIGMSSLLLSLPGSLKLILYSCTIHTTSIHSHGLRSLLPLCLPHDLLRLLRLVLDP